MILEKNEEIDHYKRIQKICNERNLSHFPKYNMSVRSLK